MAEEAVLERKTAGLGRKQSFQESELAAANPSKADLPNGV
jgi:hypothetical protein